MHGPRTRKEAEDQNCARYFTGEPCTHGHIAERYRYSGGCVLCEQVRRKKRADYMVIYQKDRNLQRKHGMTLAEYTKRSLAQDNICAICKLQTTLVVDHCHVTLEFRGLICRKCNTLLGFANDNTELLQAAIGYINQYK